MIVQMEFAKTLLVVFFVSVSLVTQEMVTHAKVNEINYINTRSDRAGCSY